MKNISTKKSAVLIAAVIVLILAGIIISVSTDKNRKKQEADSKASVSVTRTDLKNEASSQQQNIKEQTNVEILFENKAVPVGTSLKVTAIVTPDDDDKSIVWTSSNTDVFTVDKDGVITVTGSGTATLTATVGSVSDAVVIEGIRNVAAGSDNGFSVYTHTAGSISSGSNTGLSSAGEGDSRLENQPVGENKSESSQGTGIKENGVQSGGVQSGSSTTENSSSEDNNDSGSSDSGEIEDTIINNGFEQTVSNVYVCQQNGTYYGEIITQSNVTIIYIKKRNSEFDSRINNVIENLVPGNSQMIWNNYLSASTDRTFTVDGRMVRIVVATGGGHSQIVIYN